MSEKLLARLLLDQRVKQRGTYSLLDREKRRISIGKLLARVFREMLFDPKSGNFLNSINELVAPLNYALETEDSEVKINRQELAKYQPCPLQEGDRIQFGQTVLVFGTK